MPKLTVLIPCRNEQRHIEACVASARLVADEILVADSLSSDSTVQLVKAMGDCRLIEREYVTPSDFRNWAMTHAQHDWVLVVDADERVTPALAAEIRSTLAEQPTCAAFRIAHNTYMLGRHIRYGGWTRRRGPIRLFRRTICRYAERRVHEGVLVPAEYRTGSLRARFDHYTASRLDELIAKHNRYSQAGAEELVDAGRRHSLLSLVLRGPLRFFHLYVIRRGFLDGVAGFVLCTVMAHYSFLKGAKLWELQTLDQPADDGARSIPFEQATRCATGKSTTRPDQRRAAA